MSGSFARVTAEPRHPARPAVAAEPVATHGTALAPDVIGFLRDEAAKLCRMAEENAADLPASEPVTEAPEDWLARIDLAATEAEEVAEATRIEAERESLVITEERRLRLEERRAELQALAEARRGVGWRLDLLALRAEAERRRAAAAQGESAPGPGPESVTVPIGALLELPPPLEAGALFAAVLEDPSGAPVADLLAQYAIRAYLGGRSEWPMTVALVQPGDGSVWFEFTVAGTPLVTTQRLDLPLMALDSVFPETLLAVTRRGTAIVEAATLDAAFAEMERTMRDAAAAVRDSPEDQALNEVQGLDMLAQEYRSRLGTLAAGLPPEQGWLRAQLEARRDAFAAAAEGMTAARRQAEAFHAENMPGTYAGETYDELVAESEYVHEEYGWRAWRFLGNVFTLGGQTEGAENARAYRRGDISLSDYKTNYWLAIGRVGVRALTAALPVGRATGPALRFLGLGGQGAAAQMARLGADFVASSFVESLASDAYSKAAALLSGSRGVAAFQERQIAGIGGWVEGLGWGSAFMTAFGAGGRAWQGYRAAAARRGLALPPAKAQPQLPEGTPDPTAAPEVRGLKIRDEPNGDFAFFVEDTVSGKRLLVQGNRLTGEATVVDPASGQIVGSMQGGEVALHAGQLPAGAGPSAATGPAPRAADDIGAMIEAEVAGLPAAGAQAVELGVPARPLARSLREVDLSDMPTASEARYVADFPGYMRRALAAGGLPRLGNLRDYVRYRYGVESRQIVPGGGVGGGVGGGAMDPAAVRGILAGNVAERVQSMLRGTAKNTQPYRLRFHDPIRNRAMEVTVIPDFMPAARRTPDGGFARAGSAQEAVLIADSKYVWDEAGRVGLDDQIRGMLWLARSSGKPFVFLLPPGRDVSGGVRRFATAIGAEIHVVTDTGGMIE